MDRLLSEMLAHADSSQVEGLCSFLDTRCTTMPRTMLRYAIEKFPDEKRQLYLKGGH